MERPAPSSFRPRERAGRASTKAIGRGCSGTSNDGTISKYSSDGVRTSLEEFMIEQPCQTCGGKRLKPESLSVLVRGTSIGDVVDLPVERAIEFFERIPLRSSRTASVAFREWKRAA